MILIVGIPSESPVEFVTQAAERFGIPYVLFNQREAHRYNLSISIQDNKLTGLLLIAGIKYSLNDFQGVYVRMMDYNFLPELDRKKVFNYVGEQHAYKSVFIHQQLSNWIEATSCRVLNRTVNTLSNLSKPYQSQIISTVGFKVPPTCITNQKKIVEFFIKEQGSIIYKSISSSRSIVKELKTSDATQLDKLCFLPTQFQKKLVGVNIRVHVVGDALFATRAESATVDYRYSSRENEETKLTEEKLPADIEAKCFALAELLKLPLCGIDLFLTNNGEYFCFEVNPSPGFSYYQSSTEQDIAGAIVNWLAFGTSKIIKHDSNNRELGTN